MLLHMTARYACPAVLKASVKKAKAIKKSE
jgi:hypothetical protein